MTRMPFYKLALIFFMIATPWQSASALVENDKLWTAAVFRGSLSQNKLFKYYVEPDLRFIDNHYKFQQAVFWLGLGYQVHPNLIIFLGDAPSVTRLSNGSYNHINNIWQQANFPILVVDTYTLANRIRVQEEKKSDSNQWGLLIREQLRITIPIKTWDKHAIVLLDEIFFSIKRPDWYGTNNLISQNRAMIGLETEFSSSTVLTVGYLNQTQYRTESQMNHVLVITLAVNSDHL